MDSGWNGDVLFNVFSLFVEIFAEKTNIYAPL